MRHFGQFCCKCVATFILVLALASPIFAGEIPFPGVTNPPPASATGDMPLPGVTSSSATTSGDIPYPGVADDTWTETALNLLQGVMSLF